MSLGRNEEPGGRREEAEPAIADVLDLLWEKRRPHGWKPLDTGSGEDYSSHHKIPELVMAVRQASPTELRHLYGRLDERTQDVYKRMKPEHFTREALLIEDIFTK